MNPKSWVDYLLVVSLEHGDLHVQSPIFGLGGSPLDIFFTISLGLAMFSQIGFDASIPQQRLGAPRAPTTSTALPVRSITSAFAWEPAYNLNYPLVMTNNFGFHKRFMVIHWDLMVSYGHLMGLT